MPPRFAYWTILIDDAPTAFRARDRAELMGVFRQLANRNPNVSMKWFAHGKLWESPEQARGAAREAARPQREPRGPEWRPGGKHEDPRARFGKRKAKHGRENARPRDERGGRAGGHGPGGAREASTGGWGHKRWDRRKDRNRSRPAPRARHAGPFRDVDQPGTRPPETPGEPEPQTPPQPPSPERPPRPGQEPPPDTPPTETIRILPEPPERARRRHRR